jgi:hypothetical protein
VFFFAITFAIPAASMAAEGDGGETDPVEIFFAGLQMQESGDCEGAIARFQMAMSWTRICIRPSSTSLSASRSWGSPSRRSPRPGVI